MLSRRQILKFGALCDEDLAHLETQADLLLAIRHRQPTAAPPLRIVHRRDEDRSTWLDPPVAMGKSHWR